MPPTAEVTAEEVSLARSYQELFRVTGPLLSLGGISPPLTPKKSEGEVCISLIVTRVTVACVFWI